MTKKKGLYAIFAALAMFALIMTGCPDGSTDNNNNNNNGGEENPNPGQLSNNTTLSSISIDGGTAVTGATAGNDPAGVALKEVQLDSNKTNAEITLNFGSSFKGTATIAQINDTATIAESNFTLYNKDNKPKYNLEDEYKIYVKMTAENTTTVAYYGYKVVIGADATLRENGITFTAGSQVLPVTSLGTPKATYAAITAEDEGKMQFSVQPPADGWKVTVTPNDTAAKVKYTTRSEPLGPM